jgi:hypothetical protein
MKKLSNTQEYAILYLHKNIGMAVKTISKELKINNEQVEEFIGKIPVADIPTSTSSADNTDPELINNNKTNKEKGVSIMTRDIAKRGDEIQKQTDTRSSRTSKSAIFRPRS